MAPLAPPVGMPRSPQGRELIGFMGLGVISRRKGLRGFSAREGQLWGQRMRLANDDHAGGLEERVVRLEGRAQGRRMILISESGVAEMNGALGRAEALCERRNERRGERSLMLGNRKSDVLKQRNANE